MILIYNVEYMKVKNHVVMRRLGVVNEVLIAIVGTSPITSLMKFYVEGFINGHKKARSRISGDDINLK